MTVINLKGGVGKTHTTWLLASVCEERRRRVLLVDADMQANLSGSFIDEENPEPGIDALFDPTQDADANTLVRRTELPQIDLLPASSHLVRFDLADRHTWEQTDLDLTLVEPVNLLRPSYDYIIFDRPPRLSLVAGYHIQQKAGSGAAIRDLRNLVQFA